MVAETCCEVSFIFQSVSFLWQITVKPRQRYYIMSTCNTITAQWLNVHKRAKNSWISPPLWKSSMHPHRYISVLDPPLLQISV